MLAFCPRAVFWTALDRYFGSLGPQLSVARPLSSSPVILFSVYRSSTGSLATSPYFSEHCIFYVLGSWGYNFKHAYFMVFTYLLPSSWGWILLTIVLTGLAVLCPHWLLSASSVPWLGTVPPEWFCEGLY